MTEQKAICHTPNCTNTRFISAFFCPECWGKLQWKTRRDIAVGDKTVKEKAFHTALKEISQFEAASL